MPVAEKRLPSPSPDGAVPTQNDGVAGDHYVVLRQTMYIIEVRSSARVGERPTAAVEHCDRARIANGNAERTVRRHPYTIEIVRRTRVDVHQRSAVGNARPKDAKNHQHHHRGARPPPSQPRTEAEQGNQNQAAQTGTPCSVDRENRPVGSWHFKGQEYVVSAATNPIALSSAAMAILGASRSAGVLHQDQREPLLSDELRGEGRQRHDSRCRLPKG